MKTHRIIQEIQLTYFSEMSITYLFTDRNIQIPSI